MPEGDTIFRAARTLDLALRGQRVELFRTELSQLSTVDDDTPIAGRTVEAVTAAGKHLLMHFSGGLILRTHLRMHGSWHIYRRGERWKKPSSSMRIVVATAKYEAVGFNIPIAEFVSADDLARDPSLVRLGPDLLDDDVDESEILRRFAVHGDDEIAVALLNQTVAAGVGNVFKSEILFVEKINPFRKVGTLSEEELLAVIRTARKQLRMNVVAGAPSGRRTTGRMAPGESLWVYGRGGRACRRCGTPISRAKQGIDARSTYWCPGCQSN